VGEGERNYFWFFRRSEEIEFLNSQRTDRLVGPVLPGGEKRGAGIWLHVDGHFPTRRCTSDHSLIR
jgi:hypothetical protein